MRKASLPVLIVFMMGIPSMAQKNFLPGYVILNNGDQVKGEIDYRNWDQNPIRISFRSAANGIEQSFTKSDLRGFFIEGKDKYERAYVTLDMNPVALNELTYGSADLTSTDTVFLRLLVEGNRLNLYEYVDFKQHFFIRPLQGEITELLYKVKLHPESGGIVTNSVYRSQLKKYFTENPVPEKKTRLADQLNYDLNSLVKFVSMLNETNTAFIPPDAKQQGLKTKIFAGAGAVMSKLKFTGSDERLRSLESGNTFSYMIGVGIDFYSPRNLQNILLRAEVSLSEFNVEATGLSGVSINTRENTYSMKQMNITPAFAILFNFIKTQAVKIYLGPSLGFNFSSYSKHTFTSKLQSAQTTTTYEDFPLLQKTWAAVYIKGGAFIKDKVEVSLSWLVGGAFIEYTQIGENSKHLALRVHYRFK